MLKWSPEPFADDVVPVGGVAADPASFASDGAVTIDAPTPGAQLFRRESGFADAASLLASLTPEERSQVFELVEMDVSENYAARERELTAGFESRLAEAKQEFSARFAVWTEELGRIVERDLQAASAAAADLAIVLAGKILRRSVELDREALVRCLETILFKLDKDHPLTVHVSPDDATWLAGNEQVRERLHIEAVVADRRIETGGAVVKADGREWDATLGAQLETLAEVVKELVTVGAGGGAGETGTRAAAAKDRHEPGLD